ncbi:FRG domain-containing protein [Bacillus thuringiensis]|uniref:FRG domain-containing protein n=1 Tax=Bacillus thuringiensis TaxID=1428 RepID=UPI002224DC2B|nr:FRG domain-containing protein [Bacillus thuringiensis]UYX53441.1 FRG domain-containing protein [Bacillus thuringiensis]
MEGYAKDLFGILSTAKFEIDELRNFLELDEGNSIIAFRGEPQDYGDTKLLPSMNRINMSFDDEKNFFDSLRDYGIISNNSASYVEKAIEAQHYLQTSRLLDVSFNVLISIYFATLQDNELDAQLYVFCFPKCFSPSSQYINQYYKNMMDNNKESLILRNNFKVITHGYYNERMKLQSGGFVLFPSENMAPIPKCFYRTITIPAVCKESIRKDLVTYFSIYESSVFPEKEKRKEIVMEAVKRGRVEKKQNYIDLELDLYFEYLTYDIKWDIKEVSKFKNVKDIAIEDKVNKIYRKIRKASHDLGKSIEELPVDKELYMEKVQFNFEGLTLMCKEELRRNLI